MPLRMPKHHSELFSTMVSIVENGRYLLLNDEVYSQRRGRFEINEISLSSLIYSLSMGCRRPCAMAY